MNKKIIATLMSVCLSIISVNSVFAQTNVPDKTTQAEFIKSEGNTSFYLNGDKILKVVVTAPKTLDAKKEVRNADGTMTSSADVDVRLYESAPLTEEEIILARAGELTNTDEATNPMGNITAKLSVKYSWTSFGDPKLLRLISATSSYKTNISEGVVAQTCSLYWHAEGAIYKNGVFEKKGSLGTTKNYTSPTFSNVTLMSSSQSIEPLGAGVTYTLVCTRGVTIDVRIPFA